MKKNVLFMAALFFCISSAFAYDFSAVCPTGQTLYYNITDAVNHEVELTYPGNDSYFPWNNFQEPNGEIELPSIVHYNGITYNVTAVGDYAFRYCDGLRGDLSIPNSVTSIGNYAFHYCSGFSRIMHLGNVLTVIGDYAFCGCDGLSGDLVIPNSVTEIGNFAFSEIFGLRGTLTLGDAVTTIGDSAFRTCGFTGDLIIPNSVTSIGSSAFLGCTHFNGTLTISNSITSIHDNTFEACGFTCSLVIPDSVTEIGGRAFSDCEGFTGDLIIPNSVISIGGGAFSSCDGLTGNLILGNSVCSIGSYAFKSDYFVGDLVIPNSVISIGECAFEQCQYFNGNLILGNSVTNIGHRAFYGCSKFTGDLVIPNSVISIEDEAFMGCENFNGNLILGNSVTTIEEYAFAHCRGIAAIVVNCSIPPILEPEVFYNFNTSIPVYIPYCSSIIQYQQAEEWNKFTDYHNSPYYQLNVSSNDTDLGTVSIIQQPDCETDAIIFAEPNGDCDFVCWMEDGDTISTENVFQFSLMSDRNLVGCFAHVEGVESDVLLGMKIYPNPVSDAVNITGENLKRIEICNMTGQCISLHPTDDMDNRIDVSALRAGIYLLNIIDASGKRCVRKFVKK